MWHSRNTCWCIFLHLFIQKLVQILTALLQPCSDSLTPATHVGAVIVKVILTLTNKCTKIDPLLFQHGFMGLCRCPKSTHKSLQTLNITTPPSYFIVNWSNIPVFWIIQNGTNWGGTNCLNIRTEGNIPVSLEVHFGMLHWHSLNTSLILVQSSYNGSSKLVPYVKQLNGLRPLHLLSAVLLLLSAVQTKNNQQL